MATVHVVTPTYCTEANHRLPLLLQTIHSVQQQSYRDYLHIIVDDESTDSTPQILDQLARNDPHLVVFHKKNGGSSAAVNFGIEHGQAFGTAKYITICHSDDLLLPNSLEIRVALAAESGAKLVYSDAVLINEVGMSSSLHPARERASADELYRTLLKQGAGVPYLTMFWEAEFFLSDLHGYDERLTSSEDWDIALRSAKALVASDAEFAMTRTVTAAKRIHKDCLRMQNVRDGTKARCYELILKKHIQGDEFLKAMEHARRTRLAGPTLLEKVKEFIRGEQCPGLLRFTFDAIRHALHALRMRQVRSMLGLRKEDPSKPQIEQATEAFLKQMQHFDTELFIRSYANPAHRAA